MRRTVVLSIVAVCLGLAPLSAQFGGRDNEVVIYTVSAKGNPKPVIVPASTANTQSGFQVKDPVQGLLEPFGPDLAGEVFVTLHKQDADIFRVIILGEAMRREHNTPHSP